MQREDFDGPEGGYIVVTWDSERKRWTFRPVMGGEVLSDGDVAALGLCESEQAAWSFPVGNGQYLPEQWYAASVHDPTGVLNNGYKHTGLDLNLDLSPWGDVERVLGLAVYAIAPGVVTYLTEAWSGVPMIVIRHEHDGAPLWTRYAHIIPTVIEGQTVRAGQSIGSFANYTLGAGGDHLHFDMATNAFTREWLTQSIQWVDPVPILKAHLPPARVDAMLKRGA